MDSASTISRVCSACAPEVEPAPELVLTGVMLICRRVSVPSGGSYRLERADDSGRYMSPPMLMLIDVAGREETGLVVRASLSETSVLVERECSVRRIPRDGGGPSLSRVLDPLVRLRSSSIRPYLSQSLMRPSSSHSTTRPTPEPDLALRSSPARTSLSANGSSPSRSWRVPYRVRPLGRITIPAARRLSPASLADPGERALSALPPR